MKWTVTGADRETGAEQTLTIEADTEDSAVRRAGRAGLFVSSVQSQGAPEPIEFMPPPPVPPPISVAPPPGTLPTGEPPIGVSPARPLTRFLQLPGPAPQTCRG